MKGFDQLNTIKYYLKAVWAFASLLVTNLVGNYASGGTPLPVNEAGQWDWGKFAVNVVTVAGGTYAVYQARNKDKPSGNRHEKNA